MVRNDPIDIVLNVIKIAVASIIGFIIIKALLQVALG